ncbi:MAG: (Fe-S)-binding protein [Acidimicrobiia bacterium]
MGWVTAEHPTTEELNACVQCGLCLPVCPTFRLTGRETASPRGRLHAMKAVHEGVLTVDEAFEGIIDFCLGCRACEPVCPGMVPYGRALEGTRAEIAAQIPSLSHRIRAFALGDVLGSPTVLRMGTAVLGLAQRLRLTRLAPGRFRRVVGGLRELKGRPSETRGHKGGSGRSGTVGLLAGCIQDQWFRPVNRAAIELLEMAGYQVEAPESQTCCGALAAHDGKAKEAHRLAKVNVEAFAGYDMVVVTSAGCSAHTREYEHWADRGEDLGGRALDVTVAVARAIDQGLLPTLHTDLGPIAIQDPCHLRHAQRITREPRAILEAAGYSVTEIDPVGMCCGAAGMYTTLQPEASQQLGNQKADQVRSTGVMKVASANPGCEMQLRAALGPKYRIGHPIEWYLQAIEQEGSVVSVADVEAES